MRAAGPGRRASTEEGKEFGLEADIRGIEHFAARHDDDVETARRLVMPEDLSNQSFRAIPLDRAADLPGGGDAEARDRVISRAREHGHQSPADFATLFVDALIVDPASDVLVGSKGPVHRSCAERLVVERLSARRRPSGACVPSRDGA